MCINRHQTEFVGKCNDHLQLIKFWPSHAPGKGVCSGAKNFDFGSALLQPARSVCVSSEHFFIKAWIERLCSCFYFKLMNVVELVSNMDKSGKES